MRKKKSNLFEIYYFNKKNKLMVGLLCKGGSLNAYKVASDHMMVDDEYEYFIVIKDDGVVLINTTKKLNQNKFVSDIIKYRKEKEFIKVKRIR